MKIKFSQSIIVKNTYILTNNIKTNNCRIHLKNSTQILSKFSGIGTFNIFQIEYKYSQLKINVSLNITLSKKLKIIQKQKQTVQRLKNECLLYQGIKYKQ
ncbi:unnamed protein product [Paramecium octaurelia]|uniref:Uncharacterized protein n=1 Tax=Paramecium octaurelia TaxID=43137 RepID=A0A8S1VEL0_PAROT|nr:unnamed protein product [Paramecium octaurelia]